jgi:hypothetical protein
MHNMFNIEMSTQSHNKGIYHALTFHFLLKRGYKKTCITRVVLYDIYFQQPHYTNKHTIICDKRNGKEPNNAAQ